MKGWLRSLCPGGRRRRRKKNKNGGEGSRVTLPLSELICAEGSDEGEEEEMRSSWRMGFNSSLVGARLLNSLCPLRMHFPCGMHRSEEPYSLENGSPGTL